MNPMKMTQAKLASSHKGSSSVMTGLAGPAVAEGGLLGPVTQVWWVGTHHHQ